MNILHRFQIPVVSLVHLIVALISSDVMAFAEEQRHREVPGPTSVTATIGDIRVRIDGPKLWTIGRIDYKDTILGVDGSAYGTVVNIRNVGFIGTAHKEVEAENVTSLQFSLDDNLMQFDKAEVFGTNFELERKSQIRSFRLDSHLEVRDNRLYQSVRLRTVTAVEMKVIYPFMYAWTPTATAYIFGADDGTRVEGKFLSRSGQHGQISHSNMNWLAVYNQANEQVVVSRLLVGPKVGNTGMLIVDSPGVYRKFYVMCFSDEKVPAGFDGTYRIITSFCKADEATWKIVASKMAESLKEYVSK
jgi:hypothetical protein